MKDIFPDQQDRVRHCYAGWCCLRAVKRRYSQSMAPSWSPVTVAQLGQCRVQGAGALSPDPPNESSGLGGNDHAGAA